MRLSDAGSVVLLSFLVAFHVYFGESLGAPLPFFACLRDSFWFTVYNTISNIFQHMRSGDCT